MKRVVFTVIGILALTLVAAGLAEATLLFGHHGRLSDDQQARPAATPTPTPSPTPAPTLTPAPAPVPTPTPVPVRTAVTNSFVHLRAGASTSTTILANLNGGTVVTLGSYVDSQWQQVQYNGQNGYIFKTYLNY